ncbi:MAG: hypothetical protein JXD23_15015 [Spirochaetales bacterium]|nr:hypothetical protein [Spirochaetales bacterium]
MAIDFFLVPNTLTSKKGYIAQTVHRPTIGLELLIERMTQLNSGVSGPEIRGVISLLEDAVMSALLDGRSVELGGMVKLTPMVSGVLEGTDLRREGNKPAVKIACRVLGEYERRFRVRARLEKLRATDRSPSLVSLEDTKGEVSGLHAAYPNTLTGRHLKLPGITLSGIILVPRPGGRGKPVTVPLADLGVHRYSASRLMFHFSSRFAAPEWLSPDREISLFLEYRRERDGRSVESNRLETVWRAPERKEKDGG